ncbi:hypothetical protein BDA99DRAFT_530685 [Phascolomyces articulosus]|uniref:Uncharacterized protein n=1 Tax=Phascolomyces articulosus TaxID=60185 RepID=A0AAD5P6U2_9FUNG|nr:hypothetical protein BDA99DRAFT_530685 [Phascolomyces articulosus]
MPRKEQNHSPDEEKRSLAKKLFITTDEMKNIKLCEALNKVKEDTEFYSRVNELERTYLQPLNIKKPSNKNFTTHTIFTTSIAPTIKPILKTSPPPLPVPTTTAVTETPLPKACLPIETKHIPKPKSEYNKDPKTTTTSINNSFKNNTKVITIQLSNPWTPSRKPKAVQFFKALYDPLRFKYIYIPYQKRLPQPEIRQYFHSIKINPNHVLDISFPARNVLGLLIHIQYVPDVSKILNAANTPILHDFNPTDANHIRDPAYTSLPKQEKSEIAIYCHRNCCLHTLA